MPVFGLDVKCLTSDQVVRCSPVFHKSIQPALTTTPARIVRLCPYTNVWPLNC